MHDHGHHHGPPPDADDARIRVSFILAIVILAAEAAGGIMANSLALLADAGHMLTDVVALGLSWFATRQARRPADAGKTYGYHRTGILVALFNAATLIMIALFIAYEAYHRFLVPEAVHGPLMIGVALLGLAVNLYIGRVLSEGAKHNLNLRSALLHVMGDAAASAGVVVAGVIVMWTHWYPIDPLLSVAIAVLIAFGAWQIVGDTINILMEATPRGIDLEEVAGAIREVGGVKDVHDLHVWSITSGMHTLSAHVDVEDDQAANTIPIIYAVCQMLRHRYGIEHTTIQPECESCDPNGLYCLLPQAKSPAR